jgi:hypothetical protein
MSEPIRPDPLSNWSDELLLETLPIRQHIVAELDLLIKHQKAEIYARQSVLSGQEDEPSALTDRLLAVLIETRRVAAESAEEIEAGAPETHDEVSLKVALQSLLFFAQHPA